VFFNETGSALVSFFCFRVGGPLLVCEGGADPHGEEAEVEVRETGGIDEVCVPWFWRALCRCVTNRVNYLSLLLEMLSSCEGILIYRSHPCAFRILSEKRCL